MQPSRAMLSPPRLPAEGAAFNAGAKVASGRAATGAGRECKRAKTHAKPCTFWMHGLIREK